MENGLWIFFFFPVNHFPKHAWGFFRLISCLSHYLCSLSFSLSQLLPNHPQPHQPVLSLSALFLCSLSLSPNSCPTSLSHPQTPCRIDRTAKAYPPSICFSHGKPPPPLIIISHGSDLIDKILFWSIFYFLFFVWFFLFGNCWFFSLGLGWIWVIIFHYFLFWVSSYKFIICLLLNGLIFLVKGIVGFIVVEDFMGLIGFGFLWVRLWARLRST